MSNISRYTSALFDKDTMYVFSHFTSDQADTEAVDTVTDSGSVAMGDVAGGTVVLTPSDGSVVDNDEAYLATPNENFIFRTNNAIYGAARVKFSEVTAAKLNWAFGFQNAVGADSIIDDGGGLKVSGSTLGIYAIDGGTNLLRVVSACNGVATVTITNKTVVAGTWYYLEIICGDSDGVTMPVNFKVDGEFLKDANGNIIKHTVPIANATEMSMFLGAKLGASTNNDTLTADWWIGQTGPAT